MAHVDDNIVLGEFNAWFAIGIKKRRMKEAVEYRLIIISVSHSRVDNNQY
jgi:hypothetical protein